MSNKFFAFLLCCWAPGFSWDSRHFRDLQLYFEAWFLEQKLTMFCISKPYKLQQWTMGLLKCLLSSHCSLLPVLERSVCHLWILWPDVNEYSNLLLWGPAHVLCHTQLSHWRRCAVCHPDAPSLEGCYSESSGSLQVGEVRVPLRHRKR